MSLLQATRLARFVREHGNPCRVVRTVDSYAIVVAVQLSGNKGFSWQPTYPLTNPGAVLQELGY